MSRPLASLAFASHRESSLVVGRDVVVSFVLPGEVEGHQDSRRKELGRIVGMGISIRFFQGGFRDNAMPL